MNKEVIIDIENPKDNDLISRQSVKMQMIKNGFHSFFITVEEFVKDLPSVNPQKPCEDDHDGCKDCMHELKSDGEYPCNYCKQNYKDMWEKKPHLIEVDDMIYKCSECGYDDIVGKCNFCPNCGARMD